MRTSPKLRGLLWPVLAASTLVVLLRAATAWSQAGEWFEADTAGFVVLSSGGSASAMEVAGALEAFRQAFARLVPNARTEPLAPAIVLAFDRFESYEPFAPVFAGRAVRVAGSFIGSARANYLVLTLDQPEKAWTVAFHELTHLIVSQTLVKPPTWFNEGIAEFYSTFRTTATDGDVELGHVIPDHLLLLRRDPWIPLDELLTVSADSSLYNEGDRRSMFYAESWALVHYLLKDRVRADQLFDFLSRSANGQDTVAAFRAAFGMAPGTLAEELRRYVHQPEWAVQHYRLEPSDRGRTVPARARPVDQASLSATLAGFQLALGRTGEATALAQQSVNIQPNTPSGWALLAACYVDQHLDLEAVPFVLRAAATPPTDPVSLHLLGTAALAIAERSRDSGLSRADALRIARTSLESAVRVAPTYAEAWATLAHAELNVGTNPEAALKASRNARTLAPTRLHYRLFEAQALIQRGDLAGAKRLMEGLFEGPLDPQLADKAGEVLARIGTLEAARANPGNPR